MKLAVYKNNQIVSEYETPKLSPEDSFEIFIGRSSDCHLIIDDPQISREHAIIKKENNSWELERLTDIGTIIIKGESVHKKEIEEGDDISFGSFIVHVSGISKEQTVDTNPGNIIDQIPEDNIPVVKESETLTEETTLYEEIDSVDTEIPEQKEFIEDEFQSDEVPNNKEDSSLLDIEASAIESEAPSDSFTAEDDTFSDPNSESFSEPGPSQDSGDSTQMFNNFATYELEIFGEHAPYDRFVMEEEEVFIGRNQEKCKIALDDHEVSGVHAKIKKTKINLLLEDLNSTNGTLLNGARINKSELNNGDEFVIGSTTFTVKIRSEMFEAEVETLMPVNEEQEIVIEKEQTEFSPVSENSTPTQATTDFSIEEVKEEKSILKNPQKRKKLLYGLVGVLTIWLLFDEDEPKKPAQTTEQAKGETTVANPASSVKNQSKKILNQQELEYVESHYKLGKNYTMKGEYSRGLEELELVRKIDPNYAESESLYLTAKEGLAELERLEKERLEQERKAKIRAEVKGIIVEIKEAIKEDRLSLAEQKISQILERDPENTEIQTLKLEIDAIKAEQERKKQEELAQKQRRQDMLDDLSLGKNAYLKQDWYKSIVKLEEFLNKKDLDEDLMAEATKMLKESKAKLSSQVDPLLGKARALKEGQDLKGAYEVYNDIYDVDPTNEEALNQMSKIKEDLELRAKKVYREAIIAESLSLFNDAKEKYQEVQQISPTDSEYYMKATEKLKEYIE